MKIGFFGGCFNPPSNIHISIAKKLITTKIVDKVIFVPVGDYYMKNSLIEANHRYNMLKIAVKDELNIEVDDIELKSNEKLYATDIFCLLEKKYYNDEIYFIMGADNFIKMPEWKEYNKIINKYNYIIIERENYSYFNGQLKNVQCVTLENNTDESSTKIRNKINTKEDVSQLINKKVYEYILRNKLYR